ncbi:extracellular solute-binding protein [Thermosynechococcaceae cyanobacterium BACA0444]|uniref:Extracellular solute-binding protein n=1 Tax=Pseudocalidococcus azoricus BACA0444 TaxID=2918990 RepID=A0AAE4FUA8_9CYAN|nr:extracellular solute-binding protein [Pseudocalidococcus azoricus]MDS3861317.1 extracellular solute-binding protein [Pseudocalidococcus azoricus BACA0444]
MAEVMQRRSLLRGLAALGLGAGLAGCNRDDPTALNVTILRNTLPPQLINRFRQEFPAQALRLQIKTTPQDIFKQLEVNNSPSQWLSLGGAWLKLAIETRAIKPLDTLPHWANLEPRWQQLVQRNAKGDPDPQGKIWGLPYRWGTTVIAYREDLIQPTGWRPQDWADLWKPELTQKLSLLNQPREVIGLVLKKLGQSYNTANIDQVSGLKPALEQLRQQTRFFASTDYLQSLIMGDTWIAQAWSTDVLPILNRYSNIKAIVPKSGTALWADCWVKSPQTTDTTDGGWLEFWSQAEVANLFSQFSPAISPFLTDFQANGPAKTLLLPNQPTFQTSEVILPLSPSSQAQYDQLWSEVMLQGAQ